MSAQTPKLPALEAEQATFDHLLPELLKEHRGEFVVVYGQEPRGFFKTYNDAYSFALDSYGLDSVFLISEVVEHDNKPASISWSAGVMFA